MYPEDDYIMLSAIQHYVFCQRQCALIHVEGHWAENSFTAKGKLMHERVDAGEDESRAGVRITRSLNIYSKRLGISGKADVVEFHEKDNALVPFPVEYKSGKPKQNISDLAQLCAQALCLEEMLGVPVSEGAIYYGTPRRRLEVTLGSKLRNETEEIAHYIHTMIRDRQVSKAKYMKKCNSCSLYEICNPKFPHRKLESYMKGLYRAYEETS